MEPANIDWNNLEWKFVQDDLYENINAPKWFDFSAPDDFGVDDEAWFCKAECRHPKTVEDFVRSNSKVKQHLRSISASETLPFRDRNLRGGFMSSTKASMNRRVNRSKTPDRVQEDQENENPNLSTPSKNKNMKLTEKKKVLEKSPLDLLQEERKPKLKSTLSASNLFAGREIFSQITEFCHELKKMVMKRKEGESSKTLNEREKLLEGENSEESLEDVKKLEVVKENRPLLEVEKGKSEAVEMNINEKKQRKLKRDEKENKPITVDLKVTRHGQENLLQVRTNPPSPQCFSADREPLRRAKQGNTPLKPSKSIPVEKGVLQEAEQNNRGEIVELFTEKGNNQSISVAGKEARSMEMFWILKPCLAK